MNRRTFLTATSALTAATIPSITTIAQAAPSPLVDGVYDVRRDFGGVGNGIVDDTVPFTNAIKAATPRGGIVWLGPNRWRLRGAHVIPHKVALQGAGLTTTTIIPGNSSFQIQLGALNSGSQGAEIGGFTIDGDDSPTLTQPALVIGQLSRRLLVPMRIDRINTTGNLTIDGKPTGEQMPACLIRAFQNSTCIGLEVTNTNQNGIIIDDGAGGLNFIRLGTSGCGTSGAGSSLIIRETTGTGPYDTRGPSQISFETGIFERPRNGGANSAQVRIKAGSNITFDAGTIFGTTSGYLGPCVGLLLNERQGSYPAGLETIRGIRVNNSQFTGGSDGGSVGFKVESGGRGVGRVHFAGLTTFRAVSHGFQIAAGTGGVFSVEEVERGPLSWNGSKGTLSDGAVHPIFRNPPS
jgi:hypothetical protein